MCQLKLPQQVALTELKQVGAKVKVIIVTECNLYEFPFLLGWNGQL